MGTSLRRMTARMQPTETIRIYGRALPESEQLPEEDRLVIEIDRRAMTAGDLARVGEAMDTKDLGAAMAAIALVFARIVRSWSLVDDEGVAVPVSREAVLELPMWAVMEAWMGTRGDVEGESVSASSI